MSSPSSNPTYDPERLTRRLAALMREQGVRSVAELARRAARPHQTTLNIVRGINTRPQIDVLVDLARALHVPVTALLEEAVLAPIAPICRTHHQLVAARNGQAPLQGETLPYAGSPRRLVAALAITDASVALGPAADVYAVVDLDDREPDGWAALAVAGGWTLRVRDAEGWHAPGAGARLPAGQTVIGSVVQIIALTG